MEQMAINQETSYERLYRWLQSINEKKIKKINFFLSDECRLLCNDTVEINDFMSTAFFTLTQRPILYKY